MDNRKGSAELRNLGAGAGAAEAVFVPAAGADPDSDEGWVMSYVYDRATDSSELQIVDATDFTGKAVARVKLPQRVPFGFHGSWVADPA